KRCHRLAGARHQAVQGAEVLALLRHALCEALHLVLRREPVGERARAAADAFVARAGHELGTERLPDARVELVPAHHLLAELGGAAVERVDGVALVGDLPGEGPRLAGELAQLGPVPGERADHGDGEGQPDEGAYGDRPREVEPDDPGSVAPHDEQTEVVPAPQPRAGPSGVRSRGLSGYEHRVDDAVNGGWLRPHARMEPRKRRAGREGTPKHIVAKLIEAAQNPKNHRYSASRGITRLRVAIVKWYRDRYGVDLDPQAEAIVTIGAKEGLAHLALAVLQPGDGALVPNPTYPIHSYSVVIADGDLRSVPLTPDGDFFARLEETAKLAWPKAKLLILSFPHNPTTMCVDRAFFEKVVAFARDQRLMVVHDLAYADFAFDGYQPPSFLEIPGAKEIGVEIFSTSKSYNMAGWRLAFVCGNARMIHALARIKSYLDYGAFQPIQIAGIIALEGDQTCVAEIVEVHRKSRDVLVDVLNKLGWSVPKPKGTM